MMNSTPHDDEFGENPFRSAPAPTSDFFADASAPAPQPQFQQPPQQQFPPMQQQQQQALTQQPYSRGCWGTFKMLLDLNTYKAYFDIDAEDIVNRLRSVCMDFYKPEHFRNNVLGARQTNGLKGPDLYGPYWVTMTLIFLVGVTSNMHAYLHRSDVEVFEYDINHLMHAASVFSTFSFIIPAVFWITSKCMNMEALSLVEWTCLYGYSLTPFLPAVVLCVIPFGILSWVFLLAAAVVSGSLILRNVAAPMLSTDVGQAKAPPLILAILGTHLIFFLVVKFTFFHHSKK